ncbi:MAG TPA: Gfo/Idh/MocA family oxidoreductase, partial [Armatimonadota bacterium]|nr:Gfo/Idh/MocA family oxidoreductase [Armatimonadota bacterium]
MTASPLRIAIVGMGGFAGEHHDAILRLETRGECRLVCTCDPAMDAFTERWDALRFAERGVRLFRDYRAMLAAFGDELDIVTIPTPVPLHAPMHRAACRRGLAVYLEKPPTLNYAELASMLRAEKLAPKLTNVGFNFIVEPPRRALKARLVAGEFGAVRAVRVFGRWPRGSTYYTRASWAGRLLLDGTLVLDSPMGNAMAHLAHNALYWAGDAPDAWAPITAERAELYRAHPIQGTDTLFVEAETAHGPIVRLAMTHACMGDARDYEDVVCDNAVLTTSMGWTPAAGQYRDFTIRWTDGREETERLAGFRHLDENFRAYFAYVREERPRPVTTPMGDWPSSPRP